MQAAYAASLETKPPVFGPPKPLLQVMPNTRSLAPGLIPTARIDGLIEAFEDPARPWVVAVQWHPERKADPDMSAAGTRIFDAFAAAAARQPIRAR